MPKDKDNEGMSDKDTEEDSQHDSNKDQDSVSFQDEVDEEIYATEMKKIGSNSSKEAPKKPKNIWNNTRYHAGLKYTGEQNGEWHEELSS